MAEITIKIEDQDGDKFRVVNYQHVETGVVAAIDVKTPDEGWHRVHIEDDAIEDLIAFLSARHREYLRAQAAANAKAAEPLTYSHGLAAKIG